MKPIWASFSPLIGNGFQKGRVARPALFFCLIAGLCVGAPAQVPGDKIFDTRTAPGFGTATVPLSSFLKAHLPLRRPVHHFCVIGYQGQDRERRAYVHWREGNQLILWEAAADPVSAKDMLRYSRRQLDLKKDVVATEADVAGSTYLVTKGWVAKILADCRRSGAHYTVARPGRKG
jgi:hypothetical protein